MYKSFKDAELDFGDLNKALDEILTDDFPRKALPLQSASSSSSSTRILPYTSFSSNLQNGRTFIQDKQSQISHQQQQIPIKSPFSYVNEINNIQEFPLNNYCNEAQQQQKQPQHTAIVNNNATTPPIIFYSGYQQYPIVYDHHHHHHHVQQQPQQPPQHHYGNPNVQNPFHSKMMINELQYQQNHHQLEHQLQQYLENRCQFLQQTEYLQQYQMLVNLQKQQQQYDEEQLKFRLHQQQQQQQQLLLHQLQQRQPFQQDSNQQGKQFVKKSVEYFDISNNNIIKQKTTQFQQQQTYSINQSTNLNKNYRTKNESNGVINGWKSNTTVKKTNYDIHGFKPSIKLLGIEPKIKIKTEYEKLIDLFKLTTVHLEQLGNERYLAECFIANIEDDIIEIKYGPSTSSSSSSDSSGLTEHYKCLEIGIKKEYILVLLVIDRLEKIIANLNVQCNCVSIEVLKDLHKVCIKYFNLETVDMKKFESLNIFTTPDAVIELIDILDDLIVEFRCAQTHIWMLVSLLKGNTTQILSSPPSAVVPASGTSSTVVTAAAEGTTTAAIIPDIVKSQSSSQSLRIQIRNRNIGN